MLQPDQIKLIQALIDKGLSLEDILETVKGLGLKNVTVNDIESLPRAPLRSAQQPTNNPQPQPRQQKIRVGEGIKKEHEKLIKQLVDAGVKPGEIAKKLSGVTTQDVQSYIRGLKAAETPAAAFNQEQFEQVVNAPLKRTQQDKKPEDKNPEPLGNPADHQIRGLSREAMNKIAKLAEDGHSVDDIIKQVHLEHDTSVVAMLRRLASAGRLHTIGNPEKPTSYNDLKKKNEPRSEKTLPKVEKKEGDGPTWEQIKQFIKDSDDKNKAVSDILTGVIKESGETIGGAMDEVATVFHDSASAFAANIRGINDGIVSQLDSIYEDLQKSIMQTRGGGQAAAVDSEEQPVVTPEETIKHGSPLLKIIKDGIKAATTMAEKLAWAAVARGLGFSLPLVGLGALVLMTHPGPEGALKNIQEHDKESKRFNFDALKPVTSLLPSWDSVKGSAGSIASFLWKGLTLQGFKSEGGSEELRVNELFVEAETITMKARELIFKKQNSDESPDNGDGSPRNLSNDLGIKDIPTPKSLSDQLGAQDIPKFQMGGVVGDDGMIRVSPGEMVKDYKNSKQFVVPTSMSPSGGKVLDDVVLKSSRGEIISPVLPARDWPEYMSQRDINTGKGVNPGLLQTVKQAQRDNPWDQFTIAPQGGTRTQAQQDVLVARGVSKTHDSNHIGGNAVDIVPLIKGKYDWDSKQAQGVYDRAEKAMYSAQEKSGTKIGPEHDQIKSWDPGHYSLPREEGYKPTTPPVTTTTSTAAPIVRYHGGPKENSTRSVEYPAPKPVQTPHIAPKAEALKPEGYKTPSGVDLQAARGNFAKELLNPTTNKRFLNSAEAELGSQGKLQQQRYMEEVMNRATSRGHSLEQEMSSKAYYPPRTQNLLNNAVLSDAKRADLEDLKNRVLGGSNESKLATGNWSGGEGKSSEGGDRGFGAGYITSREGYGPGKERFGVEGADVGWMNKVAGRGGQPDFFSNDSPEGYRAALPQYGPDMSDFRSEEKSNAPASDSSDSSPDDLQPTFPNAKPPPDPDNDLFVNKPQGNENTPDMGQYQGTQDQKQPPAPQKRDESGENNTPDYKNYWAL